MAGEYAEVVDDADARAHERLVILGHYRRKTKRRLARRAPWFALLRWSR